MQKRQKRQAFRAQNVTGTFKKRAPGPTELGDLE